jgi:carbon storage regulator
MALILSRRAGESLKISDDIYVTVVRVGPNSVRLGITAPKDMNIARSELIEELGGGDVNDTEVDEVY